MLVTSAWSRMARLGAELCVTVQARRMRYRFGAVCKRKIEKIAYR